MGRVGRQYRQLQAQERHRPTLILYLARKRRVVWRWALPVSVDNQPLTVRLWLRGGTARLGHSWRCQAERVAAELRECLAPRFPGASALPVGFRATSCCAGVLDFDMFKLHADTPSARTLQPLERPGFRSSQNG